MAYLWIILAVLAGALQSLRTAMQHDLRDRLSANAAAMVRHLFGLPFVAGFTLLYGLGTGAFWHGFAPDFYAMVLLAALLQVVGTVLLIHSFTQRGFLVGSAFAKTEAVQAAIAAAILFGERLGLVTWIGIFVGVLGVLVVALHGRHASRREMLRALGQPAAAYGLAAAGFLAATGLAGKRAIALVGTPDPIMAALVTVGAVMAIQVIAQGAWMLARQPAALRSIVVHWHSSLGVGLVSAAGSICWFGSLAMAPVALVRIVGQTEAIFTLAFARHFLGERPHRNEVLGLAIVASGVAIAMWGGGHG